MVCPRCETANHPVDECPERHEEYHGLPSDHFDADDDGVRCWVQAIDETWHASGVSRDELRKAILQEAEEGDIGEVLLEGWQLGIYDAELADDGEVAWKLSEKGALLTERGVLSEYVEREAQGIDIEPSALPGP
jgi:hypothetical protein